MESHQTSATSPRTSERTAREQEDCSVTEPNLNEFDIADDKSIHSDTSDDSEMEPFSDYLPKIEQLLSELGLTGFSAEPLQHGYTFQNCVYALKSPINDQQQYILRVPNCPDFEGDDEIHEAILNDANLLGHLVDKLTVPRVKAYSATKDNVLGAPYTVQTRLSGQSLSDVYSELTHADKLAIVDQFVDLLAKLETVNFAMAGTFTASPTLPNVMSDFCTTAAPSVSIFDKGDEDFIESLQTLQDRAGPNLKALLISHLNGWIARELKDEVQYQSITMPLLRGMLAIIDGLDREGSLRDGRYPVVLHHWDLEPRNIMVDNSSGTWKICGVIDWDDAIAVPRPLARKPPSWIWDFNSELYTSYMDNDHQPNTNLSDENIALKAYFNEKTATALPHYLEDAYGRGRWLRRIWTFARNGIHSQWHLDLIGQLLKDWDERPKPEMIQPEKPKGAWQKSLDWLSHCFQTLRS